MKQLMTRWGRNLNADEVLQEYPREQMKRSSYVNLNGMWDYAVTSCDTTAIPQNWQGRILVPFSPETVLSGVGHQLLPDEALWYRRVLPEHVHAGENERLLLHFGAVDQSCAVYLNGQCVGRHEGGYLPFTVELTEAVSAGSGPYELVVRVRDVSDTSWHARGKQKLNRGGMYYMATCGIWQTVWMEAVPGQYIRDLLIVPHIDEGTADITVYADADERLPVTVTLTGQHVSVHGTAGSPVRITVQDPVLWECDHPKLYSICIQMGSDEVESYFALREISVEPDEKHIPRICLNHQPIFLNSVLDQGYWPDGYYTPPSDAALIFDLTEMKRFGFTTVRKHAKIESDRWYYHCDRLGLLVWQDLVNGGESYDDWYVTTLPNLRNWKNTTYRHFSETRTGRQSLEGRLEFLEDMNGTVRALRNHPSVIAWTLFNEGWGQFETKACTDALRKQDPYRLIDAASGWFDQNTGDMKSVHNYFFPFRLYRDETRASVLSEFGGLPMLVPDHSAAEKIYGYGKHYNDSAGLTDAYQKLTAGIRRHIPAGLSGSVYTQWTDIEDEVNGIYTWDREVRKIHNSDTEGTV